MAAFRRRIFLINKPFQYRFMFYVCSWLVALSIVYPLIIYNIFDYFISYLAQDPLGPAITTLVNTRRDLLFFLILLQVILLSVTAILSIFMSHRIAGPLFKLNKYFVDIASGKLTGPLHFRKGDYFHELSESYNLMMQSWHKRMQKKNLGIQTALEKAEKALFLVGTDSKREIEMAIQALKEAQDLSPSTVDSTASTQSHAN